MEENRKNKINKQEVLQAVKFTLFSLSAGVIQMVSALVLKLVILEKCIPQGATVHFITDLALDTFIADTVGLALSILWNFTFNRKFTFKSARNVPIAMLLAFAFYVPFYPFQIWYIDAVEKSLVNIGDWAFVIAQGTCMLINFVLEFVWQKFIVFRKPKSAEAQDNEQTAQDCADAAEIAENSAPDTTQNEERKDEPTLSQKLTADVVLVNPGSNKIAVIKIIRSAAECDLERAKQLVESTPVTIATGRLKDEAQLLVDKLTKAGATAELK